MRKTLKVAGHVGAIALGVYGLGYAADLAFLLKTSAGLGGSLKYALTWPVHLKQDFTNAKTVISGG